MGKKILLSMMKMPMLLFFPEFWKNKRTSNVERDARNESQLKVMGWDVLIIWECMTRKAQIESLPSVLHSFLIKNQATK